MPIDICAGSMDGMIPEQNVRLLFAAMVAAKCDATYKGFDLGHPDFASAGAPAPPHHACAGGSGRVAGCLACAARKSVVGVSG